MDQLTYWKKTLDEHKEELNITMWGEIKRINFLNERIRFCELAYNLCLEEKNKKPVRAETP